jgi:BCD family chlorophyll transporter-like MFS transporter
MLLKRLQLGLIHIAVAMTLVPINSTLNRVMIKELGISATLVAILASLPYLFSPIQMAIGSFADRHPLLGRKRTPYILLGLLLCVSGVILAPQAAYWMSESFWPGLALAALTFGAWGMGFNFAVVSYLSLASELSGEKGRSRTISLMWFMMIAGIIVTAITLSRMLETFNPQTLQRAFGIIGGMALLLGLLGLFRLEPRFQAEVRGQEKRTSWVDYARTIAANPQARLFFAYMILLLGAILGQDILLEPFGGEAFNLPVSATTRITSIWGGCVLLALLVAGFLEGRVSKRIVAAIGACGAVVAFVLIALSGWIAHEGLFYLGVLLLGLATGLATVSNLSLMLDMTAGANVGLFIGVWGMADALARATGAVMSGVVRDTVSRFAHSPVTGYVVVFLIEAAMLLGSLWLLRRINIHQFRRDSEQLLEERTEFSLVERAAMSNDIG